MFLIAPPQKLSGDALANFEIIQRLGLEIVLCGEAQMAGLASRLEAFDLVIDAIGGTGISGPLRGEQAVAVAQVNAAEAPVLAVDIPTGLDCDTGEAREPTIRARETVTFVARKRGFDNPSSVAWTGEVIVADIGIPARQVLAALS